ncbi:hypothetical protein P170DRAFT_125104 [Aspergillus steynii IBT 23096]|uniref:Uncharacterized protein n=1 Tax=Aspergillus steynii IBT 23096 TaxID=1392250 RepID=A0A2I2GJW7_9EURO|nr:uncharacterized protein P170DRAFT_125104 [Aspergillus steynii IBT 23096]PLB53178.1 hypothetical protein P170DRAFT_125104 [Aspergillus steynii IBT 23096]
MAPMNILHARQESSGGSDNCPSTISGGAIAGIVIGSIAGTLLILWLFKVCALPGARDGGEPDYGYVSGKGGTETRHRRRRRRSPSYVEYIEKPPRSVRRPAKVYLN